jgi:hypothetical protein
MRAAGRDLLRAAEAEPLLFAQAREERTSRKDSYIVNRMTGRRGPKMKGGFSIVCRRQFQGKDRAIFLGIFSISTLDREDKTSNILFASRLLR